MTRNSQDRGPSSARIMAAAASYSWPGNVRAGSPTMRSSNFRGSSAESCADLLRPIKVLSGTKGGEAASAAGKRRRAERCPPKNR